jgi:hypothetical protein
MKRDNMGSRPGGSSDIQSSKSGAGYFLTKPTHHGINPLNKITFKNSEEDE